MKTHFTVLILILCVANSSMFAQCMADAGPDKIICMYVNGNKLNTTIGGNPSVTGGKPPYTYKWETKYSYTLGNKTYVKTASDYLEDTTVANPKPFTGEKPLTFTLTVTDADGTVCKDSARISFSRELVAPATFTVKIKEGDTIKLCLGLSVSSNYPVVKYLWRPHAGIIDSTQSCLIVSPKVPTEYYPIITDSAGCVYTGSIVYDIRFSPIGIQDQEENVQIAVFPNPAQDVLTILLPEASAESRHIEFFDAQGKLIYETYTREKSLQVNALLLSKGLLLYKISTGQELIGKGKLIIQ